MKNGVTSLEPVQCIEAFYTGSSVLWSSDGKTIFTVFGSVIKTINIDSGLPGYTIGDADSQASVTCAVLYEIQQPLSITIAYASGLLCRYTLHLSKDGIGDTTAILNRRWKSTHNGPVTVMKYFNDGNVLATGSSDFSTRVWKIDSQNCIACLKGPSAVSAISFTDPGRLLVGYSDGSVHFYSLYATSKLLNKWKLHSSQIVSILLSNEEKALFLSRDQTVSSVNLQTYEKLKVVPVFEPIECGLLLERDLFTVGEEGVLKRWENDGGKLISTAKISSCRLDMILYNEHRSQFLLVSSDYNLYLVNAQTLTITGQYVGFNDEIFDIAFIGDENNLIVAANSPEIRLYNTKTWCCQLIHGHSDSVLSVANARWDCNVFASSSKDNSVILWKILADNGEVEKVEKLGIATGHTNNVTCVRFSKMSKKKFLLSVSHDLTLKLWPLPEFSNNDCLKLSSSSTLVAHAKEITSLDVSLNDRLCVTGSMDKCAKLWHVDPATMSLDFAGTLNGHRRGIWDVRFSDGTQVVGTCCGDCYVRVFSVTSLDCIATLSGHSFAVLQMTFINNGKQLISADGGGLLKIWNINDNDCVSTVEAHDDKIWTLVASKDETRLVTAGTDGRIRIWKDVTEQKLEEEEALNAQKIQNEQKLSNLIEQKRFSEALSFTLTLEKPYNCYNVLMDFLNENPEALYESVAKLDDDQLIILLDFTAKWNTNSSTARIAQEVINRILRIYDPDTLLKLPNFDTVLESLIPYTKRHLERLTRLQENASFIDFVWSQMRLS